MFDCYDEIWTFELRLATFDERLIEDANECFVTGGPFVAKVIKS